jgi:hypothetical protein
MHQDFTQALSNADYRPYKEPGLGVYPGLEEILVKTVVHPDSDGVIPHVMATCAGYAYAGFGQKGDTETVSMIMGRMGLEKNRCELFEQRVDAMFITSGAYLVQSEDGRVVILCYRGTQPEDIISILTDADVLPERIKVDLDGDEKEHYVHAGFYRNMRATRYLVIDALGRAIEGESIQPRDRPEDVEEVPNPLEALYITGHSLGGAMAALMGVALVTEPAYKEVADKLRAIYTFGQPMLGDQRFADACENIRNDGGVHVLRDNLIRYIYERDVVPHLPPRPVGPYAPFGREYRHERRLGWSDVFADVTGRTLEDLTSIPGDLGWAARNPHKVPEAVTTAAGNTVNGGLNFWGGAISGAIKTAGAVISDPINEGGKIAQNVGDALVGSPGKWKERTDRAKQIPNVSGLAIVAPLAYLAKRVELTRTLPFRYSFEDHVPNHYISTLAPKGVRSEFGDVR